MKARIINFRGGKHTQIMHQMIVSVEGVSNREQAVSLQGKTITWTTPAKKVIKGKITALHGNKGAVRVQFEQGMPGQSVGKEVQLQ